jgi:hypothetical protein
MSLWPRILYGLKDEIQKKFHTSMSSQDGPEAQNKLRNYQVDGGLETLGE